MFVDPWGLYTFTNMEEAQLIANTFNTLAGYTTGNGYTIKEDDGVYKIINQGGIVSGGSEVAKAIINIGIDKDIAISFSDEITVGESLGNDKQIILSKQFLSTEYVNELKFALIHEVTHSVTQILGFNNKIIFNDINNTANTYEKKLAKETVILKYQEAVACMVENTVREDFGYSLRDNIIGVNAYGCFPMEYGKFGTFLDPLTRNEHKINEYYTVTSSLLYTEHVVKCLQYQLYE